MIQTTMRRNILKKVQTVPTLKDTVKMKAVGNQSPICRPQSHVVIEICSF